MKTVNVPPPFPSKMSGQIQDQIQDRLSNAVLGTPSDLKSDKAQLEKNSANATRKRNVRKQHIERRIDDALEDSFPASDPPQWSSIAREEQGKA